MEKLNKKLATDSNLEELQKTYLEVVLDPNTEYSKKIHVSAALDQINEELKKTNENPKKISILKNLKLKRLKTLEASFQNKFEKLKADTSTSTARLLKISLMLEKTREAIGKITGDTYKENYKNMNSHTIL